MTIARLPREAALKFSQLRDEVEESNNAKLSIQRRISETQNQLRHVNKETEPENFAAGEAEIRRQSARRDAAQHKFLTLDRRLTAVVAWLAQLAPNVTLLDATPPENPVAGSKTDEAGVDLCREEIYRLTEARKHVARAVLPLDALLGQVDSYVDALAKRGTPALSMDKDQLTVRHSFDGYVSGPSNALAMMAWLHGAEMKQRLRDDAMALREEKERHLPVMTAEARKSKLRELDARLFAVELEEEALIVDAGESGLTIERRENASPAAVLGVEVRKPGDGKASGAVMSTKTSLVAGKATGAAAKARSA